MNFATILIFGSACVVMLTFFVAAASTSRSLGVMFLGFGLTVLSGGLAYYAIAESQSAPWGLGYAGVAITCAAATAFNWFRTQSESKG